MKKNNYWAFLPFLFFILIGVMFGFGMWGKRVSKDISPMIGKPMPYISAQSLDGQNITLETKPMMINFFASWCAPCREEHKQLLQIAADKNINLIGIAYRDDPKNTKEYIDELGDPYQVILIDRQGAIGASLGLSGVPETYIIGKDGLIKYKHKGEITPNDAADLVKLLK